MESEQTQIDFENRLTSTDDFNIYKYRNFYNGGGVGIGDVNNDGLPDLYLTANMEPNRLYLNRGNWQFEDVTPTAGVGGSRAWSTGVSMVDINADGHLDIYVCNSGDIKGDNKQNEFFINNGDGTFSDRAPAMGVADRGYSTHAAFFDYDKDGDLDLYLLNNSYRSINSFNLKENERPIRDSLGGDKLFRNDGGRFTDVSVEAGIYGSEIGFGLGVSVADLDKDGWQDLYISNDFFERDYLYMNNGDGTFSETLEEQIRSISNASMGVDAADITGDGYPEIFVNDMLPETNERFKTTMTFENWDKYRISVRNDYYHQYTRNTLQLNNGNAPGKGLSFSEVGRLAGVEATDWSWSALLNDLDNDGHKDLYITNGIYQDILNQDFIQYIASEQVARMVIRDEGVNYQKLIDLIPINRIPNYAYAGREGARFKDRTQAWGLAEPSHSNGAAYGDLDNDGDLDLIVNNVNMPLFVYQNQLERVEPGAHYLKLVLQGSRQNPQAVGAQVTLKSNGKLWYQEQYPNRGFQSSVDNRLNFGLGPHANIDTLHVRWPYGGVTLLTNVSADQTLVLVEEEAGNAHQAALQSLNPTSLFREATQTLSIDFRHRENSFADFDHERLIYHMKSTEGPRMTVADVNEDGLDDFYIGGAKDAAGQLFIQQDGGRFQVTSQPDIEKNKASEDLESLFFDADGDGDVDLYVVSGGSEFGSSSFALVDRLYFNDGKGRFSHSGQSLPVNRPVSTATVNAADYDGDGDLDLFVGGRLQARAYGVPAPSYLLKNDGAGRFTSANDCCAPAFDKLGLVTDAVWTDYDRDNDPDLFVVGEWMALRLFENENGKLREVSQQAGLEQTNGWWNAIVETDLNQDGAPDYLIGNHGLNSRFQATRERPISCYINDFDRNGAVEQIICQYNGDQSYPTALRHDLITQMPPLKKQLLKYEDYKDKTIHELFDKDILESAIVHRVYLLESIALLNDGKGGFAIHPLPREAQYAPIYAFRAEDFNRDGKTDIVLGGNLYGVKPEVGRYDASQGLFLEGRGDGAFRAQPAKKSGLVLEGQIRDLETLQIGGQQLLIAVRNNAPLQLYEWTPKPELLK